MEYTRLRVFVIMSKTKTVFICQSCGAEFPKWGGQCSQCGKWNTLAEEVISPRKASAGRTSSATSSKICDMGDIQSGFERSKTGIFEFDRVYGGGIVPGSITLLAGEPGIGKSTLLLQLAHSVASNEGEVLFVCGEESPVQINSRARRLGIHNSPLKLLPETDVDAVLDHISKHTFSLVIVDSVQTLTTEDLSGGAGSLGQVRECSERLRRLAKKSNIPIILVGHVTKSGGVAGPKVLEHLVDGVFTLEGDKFHTFRILRASKNRFGSNFEVGVFEMKESGLEEVENPSALFLSQRSEDSAGSVVIATLEGTRPVLVEVQALAVPTKFKYPRRSASGFSNKRLELLCAVLERRVGLDLQGQDVYVNVAAGMRVSEPAADLGVVLALSSAVTEAVISPKVCAFGEVGLSGELRNVSQKDRREKEAERLGFSRIVAPPEASSVKEALSKSGISL